MKNPNESLWQYIIGPETFAGDSGQYWNAQTQTKLPTNEGKMTQFELLQTMTTSFECGNEEQTTHQQAAAVSSAASAVPGVPEAGGVASHLVVPKAGVKAQAIIAATIESIDEAACEDEAAAGNDNEPLEESPKEVMTSSDEYDFEEIDRAVEKHLEVTVTTLLRLRLQ